MIDTEVVRLRRLRNVVLRTRAIAVALDSDPSQRSSVFSRSAVNCWRIACTITGRLRAHPYLAYQRGPSNARGACDRVVASLTSDFAKYRGRGTQLLFTELQRVAHELEDARSLTWCVDFSSTLGRAQPRLQRLMREVDDGAHHETGSRVWSSRRAAGGPIAARAEAEGVRTDWPYLAF